MGQPWQVRLGMGNDVAIFILFEYEFESLSILEQLHQILIVLFLLVSISILFCAIPISSYGSHYSSSCNGNLLTICIALSSARTADCELCSGFLLFF